MKPPFMNFVFGWTFRVKPLVTFLESAGLRRDLRSDAIAIQSSENPKSYDPWRLFFKKSRKMRHNFDVFSGDFLRILL